MIYNLARDQKDKFKDGLDVYKLIENDELVVRRSRRSSAELGPGCPSCYGRLEAEHAADAAMRGRGVTDRSVLMCCEAAEAWPTAWPRSVCSGE
eukprot:10116481-Heterocapsa_arctica.AAC.1